MPVACEYCGNELPGQVKFCPKCGGSVTPPKSYDTNVSTEPLFSHDFQRETAALIPDTEELPPATVSTDKVSPPATDVLKTHIGPAATPTAPIPSKSPMKVVAIVGLFVLVAVAALSLYFATGNSADTVADANATPSPTVQPTPTETPQPQASAAPDVQSSPQETAEKTPEGSEVSGGKPKAAVGSTAATPTGKTETGSALTAEDHIKLGVNAKNPSTALAEYQQALKLDPANRDVYYLMGLSYQQLGQSEQALNAYRQCTSGKYASVAAQHVKRLEKELKKAKN
ncbi:MAG: tetratricopeptide repeat protein [Acidobacteria bacterium]|nr:tetratricopeptide repeat protein [Acidobacteriota bacterium]